MSYCWDGPTGPHSKSCGCPCVADGCKHAAGDDVQAYVTEMQGQLRQFTLTPTGWMTESWHTPLVFDARRHIANPRSELRRSARWWELEAMRGYTGVVDEDGMTSSDRSRMYAANQRWLVELMDAGRAVTSDARGVYVDGELASKVAERNRKAAEKAAAKAEKDS